VALSVVLYVPETSKEICRDCLNKIIILQIFLQGHIQSHLKAIKTENIHAYATDNESDKFTDLAGILFAG